MSVCVCVSARYFFWKCHITPKRQKSIWHLQKYSFGKRAIFIHSASFLFWWMVKKCLQHKCTGRGDFCKWLKLAQGETFTNRATNLFLLVVFFSLKFYCHGSHFCLDFFLLLIQYLFVKYFHISWIQFLKYPRKFWKLFCKFPVASWKIA